MKYAAIDDCSRFDAPFARARFVSYLARVKAEKIRLFVKPFCGWCHEAKDWLEERSIPYEELDVISSRAAWKEMVQISGQSLAPVIDVDGEVLADFDTDQLEQFWKKLEAEEKV